MKEQDKSQRLVELINRFNSGTPDVQQKMLDAGVTCERVRPGTAREAATILGVHPRTIARYADAGVLRRIRISPRRIRFDLNQAELLSTEGIERK